MPVLLKDTLTTQPVNENATPNPGSNFTTIDGETRNTAGMTPYRVLQELRPDATEDQKDSAIQAHFKVGDIAYNTRTDTITTFGIRVLKVKPFEKTRFMDTTYFHGGKYFHPELGLPRVGVAGDPAPYLLRNDNTITSLLLGCFLLAMFSFSFSKNLFLQQLKNFFFVPRSVAEMTATALERRFQWFFILQTAMLLGIIYYVYQAFYLHTDFVIDSQLALIALFAGFFTLYFGVKYTDSDVRAYVTLIRWDVSYFHNVGPVKKPIRDYKNIWGYLKELYAIPAFRHGSDPQVLALSRPGKKLGEVLFRGYNERILAKVDFEKLMADDGSRRTLSKTPDEVFLRHPEGETYEDYAGEISKTIWNSPKWEDRNPKNGVLSVDASINPLKGLL